MTRKIIEIRIVDKRQSTTPKKWIGFLSTAGLFLVLFIPGLLADSIAMQWAGFVIMICMLILVAMGWSAKLMTIEDARAELERLESI